MATKPFNFISSYNLAQLTVQTKLGILFDIRRRKKASNELPNSSKSKINTRRYERLTRVT